MVLEPQPWMVAAETKKLFQALSAAGIEARFVGGCVRDALLGKSAKDVDVATPARPERVIECLQRAGVTVIPTGLAHGTVTAVIDGRSFEVTTLRRDVETDGRHAQVAFTDDWDVDAARRDLTFNALSCSVEGRVFDPFGGVEDIRAGRVRFVGRARDRIAEDVLRLLRWFRFYARLGVGAPDAEALAAIEESAPMLPRLSGERVRAEVCALLQCERCADVWSLMISTGVMTYVIPEATNVERLRRVLAQTKAFAAAPEDGLEPMTRLAALLTAGAASVERTAARLRLSNAERGRLRWLSSFGPEAAAAKRASTQWMGRALLEARDERAFWALARLLCADAEDADAEDADAKDESARAIAAAAAEWVGAWRQARFPLRGGDLAALGVAAGPDIGRRLREMTAWWADERFAPTWRECVEELRRRLGKSFYTSSH